VTLNKSVAWVRCDELLGADSVENIWRRRCVTCFEWVVSFVVIDVDARGEEKGQARKPAQILDGSIDVHFAFHQCIGEWGIRGKAQLRAVSSGMHFERRLSHIEPLWLSHRGHHIGDISVGRFAATDEPFLMLKLVYTIAGGVQARVYP
jgi:hypothetical protein